MEQRKRAGPSHEEDQQPQRDAKRGKSISVSGLRSVYGKITTFPKKERAYARWRAGEKFGEIARNACVAEATAEVYVIDIIASGVGNQDLHRRLIRELKIQDEFFEQVQESLTRSGITLREIRDTTQLSL
ncbi:hypothetical protein OS493_029903 [Desmophyllum pertusum]|uniref:Uncharacterized protein n=1 Tax=Desmophyllum pertusum TaxID=174260 RepID=A0A9X0CDA2_9CNID|nr:hypothetical protein OS493_029903 [Desmophyllum pertusum]